MWRRGRSPATTGAFDSLRLLDQHVRPDFRKAVVFGLVALVALVGGSQFGDVSSPATRSRLIAYGGALLVAVAGAVATRTAAREVHRVTLARAGNAAATPLRLLVLLVGYLVVLFAVCDLLGVGLRNLLVGGAVTGVILGLAAQPVLGNLFAGLVLIFARPYVPGQRVRVMSGAINGPHAGVIVSAGLLYTMLETADGPLNIPNSALLAAAVGPFDGDYPPPVPPVPAEVSDAAAAAGAAAATTAAAAGAADTTAASAGAADTTAASAGTADTTAASAGTADTTAAGAATAGVADATTAGAATAGVADATTAGPPTAGVTGGADATTATTDAAVTPTATAAPDGATTRRQTDV